MVISFRKMLPACLFSYGIFIIFLVLFCNSEIFSQDRQVRSRLGDLNTLIGEKKVEGIVQPEGVALESTVDPTKYFVGPSDVVAVNIWMSPPWNFSLTVTPEGTLIIPTVGEVWVSDMTLAQAKEFIIREVRKKYITADVTVTLLRPRPIIVTVTGHVLNEGLYTLSAIDRVNKAIEEANKLTRIQRQYELRSILQDMSTRNIVLKRKDGSRWKIDLTKFLATMDDDLNPYLREGDVIIVPRKNRTKNMFGIYGEVNAPGRYELVDGDSLHDAIQIAQGFTRLAMKDSVEFSRLNEDGTELSERIVDIDEVLGNKAQDFALEPGDRIIVKARREMREDYRVKIEGEVVYPGIYPITKDHTKLSEVVQQAGGFTEFAALKAAVLNRRSVLPIEMETERLMSLRGGVSAEDSADYYLETELRLRKEIVNVDFEKLFVQGDSTQDVILHTDDYITIPSVKNTIYVFGQIVSPGHIPYVQGESARYYIRKAGGFTERAREGDIKIIKGKTKQWLAPDETIIEDGDYIWVPKVPERPFAYYMNIASQAASVLSVIIGVAVIIVQVTE